MQDLLRHASEGRCRINCHLQAVTIGPQSINILVRLQVKMDRMDKCSARHKQANAMQSETSRGAGAVQVRYLLLQLYLPTYAPYKSIDRIASEPDITSTKNILTQKVCMT